MAEDVLGLDDIDRTQVAIVGGKGASLGELSRIDGIRVPPGFCVTTDAFRRTMASAPALAEHVDRLSRVGLDDPASLRSLSADVRRTIEQIPIAEDLAAAIGGSLSGLGDIASLAVRSSATTEDLPTASFAGLHDTYLEVTGSAAVLQHVRRCWASLFNERAVTYRLQNGVDHRLAQMAVVVQQMIRPRAAGVLFTADPVTSNRRIVCIEATFGLGEALVSGRVRPDVYRVRGRELVAGVVAGAVPALTDEQVVGLSGLGRRIEAHFGRPQDVEWCLDEDGFQIVQSRPITSLFPIPPGADPDTHVYVSVGHAQMMTDAMKPLGLSFWQMTTPRPMAEAGGRLFVDVAPALATPASRAGILATFGRADPLTGNALRTIVERGDVVPALPDAHPSPAPAPADGEPEPIATDPAVVTELIERTQASIAALEWEIRTKSGQELVELISADLAELRRILFDRRSHEVFMSAMEATWWLNDRLEEWLGDRNAADTLSQSVPHNVTSEMGLALLDVADAIRPHPEVVAFLERVEDEAFLDELPALEGGREAGAAIRRYLDKYGMRCVGEIDITRPRWRERPSTLLPLILGNVRNAEPGAARRRFEQGLQEARGKEEEVMARLRDLPDGEFKAAEAKQKIDRIRTFIGYREYPKYGMVSRYFVYKQALLAEAERLVDAGVLHDVEDIFYLRFEELADVVRTQRVDEELVRERKEAFGTYEALVPPRVFTSDGEVVPGTYAREGLPVGALVGLPVSAGTVEGRARVVHDVGEAELETGDILVTVYTDPSWTPAFLAVAGLVTEVGGLMTHGAVIAREYGLPAVVGVEGATRLIRDGQRIRVDGTEGYVEILS